jgi:hypothetical protein
MTTSIYPKVVSAQAVDARYNGTSNSTAAMNYSILKRFSMSFIAIHPVPNGSMDAPIVGRVLRKTGSNREEKCPGTVKKRHSCDGSCAIFSRFASAPKTPKPAKTRGKWAPGLLAHFLYRGLLST